MTIKTVAISMSLLALTGCGATPAGVISTGTSPAAAIVDAQHDRDKEIDELEKRGVLVRMFGSNFEASVRAIRIKEKMVMLRLEATADSDTPGRVWVNVELRNPGVIDPRRLKVGDVIKIFVNYTLVIAKTGRVFDTGHPYSGFFLSR